VDLKAAINKHTPQSLIPGGQHNGDTLIGARWTLLTVSKLAGEWDCGGNWNIRDANFIHV